MGLTIHYEIRAARCDIARAKMLVREIQRRARDFRRRGRIEKIHSATTARNELERWACGWVMIRENDRDGETVRGIAVPPLEGCIFPVEIGDGCEPLWLGLCRYPASVTHGNRTMATRLGRGWRLRGASKTQYASLHGWEHFRRCHTAIIALLRTAAELGATVRITDEGEWWPRRSDDTLRRKLDETNGIVAGLAGALKDASEEPGGVSVASPIFKHPQFERIEAAGAAQQGAKLEAARRIVSSLGRDRPADTRDST